MLIPLVAAGLSPLLAWRSPIYITAGFAGVVAMALLLLQPLLAGGAMPELSSVTARRVHRWVGASVVAAVLIHVIGLWITSPPDVVDALLFRSPTPFSAWGVIAMWAMFALATLAVVRRRWRVSPLVWRRCHAALAVAIIGGTVAHAVLIQGTMETMTKLGLSLLVILAGLWALWGMRLRATQR